MPRRRRDPASYDVGYGKPPVANRFPPGRSGNPRGRPKGSRSIGTILESVLNQKVAVTEKGRTRKVTVLEFAVRRLAQDAVRGDARALKILLPLVDRLPSTNTELDMHELSLQDAAILQRLMTASVPDAETASKRGKLKGQTISKTHRPEVGR